MESRAVSTARLDLPMRARGTPDARQVTFSDYDHRGAIISPYRRRAGLHLDGEVICINDLGQPDLKALSIASLAADTLCCSCGSPQ